MKILLFGGSGWLGHNIALLLKAKKYDFTIVTRGKKQTFMREIADFETITADKTDEASVKQIFESAAYTHVIDTVPSERSVELISKYARGLRHYMHCSSTGGYAPLPFVPCNESALYKGFLTGWQGKRAVDALVMKLFSEQGFPATVIRPCYITGAGTLPLDNFGGRREDFISDIIAEKTLDLPNDGKALLQPIHVKDLANSFYLSMEHHDRSTGQIYNICLNHAFTLNDYLALNASAFNKKVNINYMSVDAMLEKYGDTISELGLRFLAQHMCFSIEKAKRDLEYAPAYTPEEAVIETALWAAGLRR